MSSMCQLLPNTSRCRSSWDRVQNVYSKKSSYGKSSWESVIRLNPATINMLGIGLCAIGIKDDALLNIIFGHLLAAQKGSEVLISRGCATIYNTIQLSMLHLQSLWAQCCESDEQIPYTKNKALQIRAVLQLYVVDIYSQLIFDLFILPYTHKIWCISNWAFRCIKT